MTSIFSGVNATSSAASATTDSKVGKGMGSMDGTDFLKLLTTQLQNQDPTDPMDNSQMLAQMAQFTSLSNSTEQTSTLKAIADKLDTVITNTGTKTPTPTPTPTPSTTA
ncbi:flagellar hook assembly protein FlgD [Novosphingobium sp. JCM 18896]|uniref:flagellar hook assembly protein FlgD n=1 Tax=Novosphingobium sp. JCM 18896 TaxID=2989731 RepID=UPI0022236F18|nr:flagellar hook capping FlgD N-terminal domain-containing protein [Novosphingobium sp. JCM 18896]MCW1428831.1 flagellar biosynthesis protein FlgD [Novosphingobium sp. JCM 18896]